MTSARKGGCHEMQQICRLTVSILWTKRMGGGKKIPTLCGRHRGHPYMTSALRGGSPKDVHSKGGCMNVDQSHMQTRGRGSKIPKILRTSYMDTPIYGSPFVKLSTHFYPRHHCSARRPILGLHRQALPARRDQQRVRLASKHSLRFQRPL